MLDVKICIKGLISSIYECQKKTMFNRRITQEQELEGKDTSILQDENKHLEEKIIELKHELRKHYTYSI